MCRIWLEVRKEGKKGKESAVLRARRGRFEGKQEGGGGEESTGNKIV